MSLRIIFAGTPDFAVPVLQALIDSEHEVIAVYTQPDRPSGRGRKVQESSVKTLALEKNIPVFQPVVFFNRFFCVSISCAVARSVLLAYFADKCD